MVESTSHHSAASTPNRTHLFMAVLFGALVGATVVGVVAVSVGRTDVKSSAEYQDLAHQLAATQSHVKDLEVLLTSAAAENGTPVKNDTSPLETTTPSAVTPAPAPPGPPSPPPAKVALPPTVPGDGTFEVGRDIAAGTYRNAGTRMSGAPCVAYASKQPNDLQTYLRGSTSVGPATVTVHNGEFFNTAYCKDFTKQ